MGATGSPKLPWVSPSPDEADRGCKGSVFSFMVVWFPFDFHAIRA